MRRRSSGKPAPLQNRRHGKNSAEENAYNDDDNAKRKEAKQSILRKIPILSFYLRNFELFTRVANPNERMLDVAVLDDNYRQVALLSVCAYLSISALVLQFGPSDCTNALPAKAQTAELLVSFLMFFSLMTRIYPMVLGAGARLQRFSGIFIAVSVVQIIGGVANGIMGVMSCGPIVTDSITGTKLNLLRWSEYNTLGFAMGFLTDSLDATDLETPFRFAFSEGFGITFGFFFAVDNKYIWALALILAIFHFCPIYFRLYAKRQRYLNMKAGETVEEVERNERARIAYRLTATCAISWTILVLNYIACWIGSLFFGFGPEILPFTEAAVDLIAKHFYLYNVVEAHHLVFDDKGRTQRRLEELRRMMSIVWSTSSDVLLISVKGSSGRVKTQISPAITKMYGCTKKFNSEVFLIDCTTNDLQPMTQQELNNMPPEIEAYEGSDPSSILQKFGAISLLAKAWSTEDNEMLFQHHFYRADGKLSHCEAKVTFLNDCSIVAIVRDITERQKRFEAEKKVVSELTARKKDAEANRFTRHEVKNGLLAAIGLCDNIRDTTLHSSQIQPIIARVDELDLTLNQTLDVVITEVIARDVINGVYIPRLECIDLKTFFAPILHKRESIQGAFTRLDFTFNSQGPFPLLEIDPLLLKYVHRNALTNARKYGEKGGLVTTEFCFDGTSQLLTMNVVNLPGANHEEILKFGKKASDIVFTPGMSLHEAGTVTDHFTRSNADGAWIMRNCARALGGNCDIEFQVDKTIFEFHCHAKPVLSNPSDEVINIKTLFPLPSITWGIGIDDSNVQRKLLKRYFSYLGIHSERTIIKGSNYAEISSFVDFVVDMVKINPDDLFLIIADENLDVHDDGNHWTILGSLLVQSILEKLGPLKRNMLALIRSANDSSDDIALYNSRAHGFIPKAPLKKEKALELVAPHWVNRFGRGRDETASLSGSSDDGSMVSESYADIRGELSRNLERIDSLMNYPNEGSNWAIVKELLHALKGDLMTHTAKSHSQDAIEIINMIRETDTVDEYVQYQWKKLKGAVDEVLLNIY